MPINSRTKGAAGEREWAKYLTDHGHTARRGQQFSGSPDSPDVVCESLSTLHFEVKRTEKLSLYKAMAQAQDDCGDKVPIVVHRRSREDWLVVMPAQDFLHMMDYIT